MLEGRARILEASKAAKILVKSLGLPSGNYTIADVSEKSGLALRNAERGLHFLVSEYRGHLSATEKGEVLFQFPYGFSKPWEKTERLQAIWNQIKQAGLGVAKFVVRAWISIVLIGYVVIFAAILLGLSFAKSSDRDSGPSFGGTILFHTLFRIIIDSLFWTMHPFSPFYLGRERYYAEQHYRSRKKGAPFYEKVNRFFLWT